VVRATVASVADQQAFDDGDQGEVPDQQLSRLPRRDGVVEKVHELVRSGSGPAVLVVEIVGFDSLAGTDAIGARGAVADVEERLDRVVRGRDVLGFEPPARFLLGCASLQPAAAGGVIDRIRSGAAFPVEVGGEAMSLMLDVGCAFWSAGASGESLVAAAEADLLRSARSA